MRIKTALLGIVAILIAGFLALNWRTLSLPASFDFLVGRISMPTGLLIMGLLLAVSLVFSLFMGLWQHGVLAEYRRQSRELRAQRDLAEAAETSRFTALSVQVREDLAELGSNLEGKLGQLHNSVSDAERSLAAMIAELDDRLHSGSEPR